MTTTTTIIQERVKQFAGQTQRYLAGELSGPNSCPATPQNGLYVQRMAPMLRICVPYGMLSSVQLRRPARITRDYDKGLCPFYYPAECSAELAAPGRRTGNSG